MKRLVLATTGIFLAATACAETRHNLAGYEEIRFGMTQSELQQVSPSVSDKSVDGRTWMSAYDEARVEDMNFAKRILIERGAVRRVSLLGVFPVGAADCGRDFSRLVDHFAARHGAPDTRSDEDGDMHRAEFRFADSSQIEISSQRASSQPNGHDDVCAVSVVFNAPGWAF